MAVIPDSANMIVMHHVVVTGKCTACIQCEDNKTFATGLTVCTVSKSIRVIRKHQNIGMDFASHNISLMVAKHFDRLKIYGYFLFLNSSIKGPLFPLYMPASWHWSSAFTSFFSSNIHGVSSALVCLPSADAGGPGPRMESWAFALDSIGLHAAMTDGAFDIRNCKLCDNGIVLKNEYALTKSLLSRDYNIATLMSKYQKGTDWRSIIHWNCNDNVHPSRPGTYDGISLHPFETIFVKSSWHVADSFQYKYSEWREGHAINVSGTHGFYNKSMYDYAISDVSISKTTCP